MNYVYLGSGGSLEPYPARPIGGHAEGSVVAGGPSAAVETLDDRELDEFLSRWNRTPIAEPLDSLIHGGRESLREQVREILFQLQLRAALSREQHKRTKQVELDVRSKLLNLEDVGPFSDPNAEKRRGGLESRLDSVYREQTRMELEFWKDQQSLRERLVELLGEYRLAAARDCLLRDVRYRIGDGQ